MTQQHKDDFILQGATLTVLSRVVALRAALRFLAGSCGPGPAPGRLGEACSEHEAALFSSSATVNHFLGCVTNFHKLSGSKQHTLTVPKFLAHPWVLCIRLAFQVLAWPVVSLRGSTGERSASVLPRVIGGIHFLPVVGLRLLFLFLFFFFIDFIYLFLERGREGE